MWRENDWRESGEGKRGGERWASIGETERGVR